MNRLLLGVDVGTHETKGMLIDESFRPVAEAVVPHEIENPQPGFYEMDAEIWWKEFCRVTKELLKKVEESGISIAHVTLHVGLGTFRPVKEEEILDHVMHSEYCAIPEDTARIINETKRSGSRVIAVGTTSCRTLESFTEPDGTVLAKGGWTDIFIYPGYTFKCIDALVTNFHLPESTLIMLVSALAGRENVLHAYQVAVEDRYRFFSFGDAMFIY